MNNVYIHQECPLSAACLIAWTIGGNLVTEPKGKGYVSYIQERKHVPDHQAQAKVIHTAHVHPAHEGLTRLKFGLFWRV